MARDESEMQVVAGLATRTRNGLDISDRRLFQSGLYATSHASQEQH